MEVENYKEKRRGIGKGRRKRYWQLKLWIENNLTYREFSHEQERAETGRKTRGDSRGGREEKGKERLDGGVHLW